ncbi:protein GVQW3-like [Oratosquilla oratoria]|uniref:protein GVQW3-like n=1 Tax=Oratosquilla oratoria TaxID=337810 RepID=UPI003F75F2A1
MEPVECRAVIRFLYLKGRTPQETFDEMKETYGDDAPSYDLVKRWHREFKHGRNSVETAPRPGRPPSAIDEAPIRQVEAAILEDRRITTRQIDQEVKISTGSVETVIHDNLYMHKVSARWIPRLLTPFQKQERVVCSRMNLEMCQEDESKFFKKLITQDETWVHQYDPETKAQSMQWKHLDSLPPKKARVQPSAGKVMLTVF